MFAINNGSHRRFSRPLPTTTSIQNVPTKTTTNRRKILANTGRSTCDKLQPNKRQQETPFTVLPKEQKDTQQMRGLRSLPYSASRTSPNVKRFATNQTASSTNNATRQTKPNKNSLKINQRVIIFSSNLVGTIRYIGEPNFAKKNGTTWIGIELETKGAGKNDGSVQGVQYFKCPPNSGLFVVASKVDPFEDPDTNNPIEKKTAKPTLSTARKSKMTVMHSPATKSQSTKPLTRNRSAATATLKQSKSARAPMTNQSNPAPRHRLSSTKPASILKKSTSLSTDTPRPNPLARSQSSKTVDELMRRPPDTDPQDDAAWQRLLSLKESYAVQLHETQTERTRLQRTLEDCAQTTEQMTAERDAALDRARMSEAMERQQARRIERLEQRIRRLQQDATDVRQRLDDQGRDDGAAIDQLRKQLAQRDEMMGVIERESSQVQQDHRQTIDSYETALAALQAQHVVLDEERHARIAQLEQTLRQLTDRPPDVNVAAQRLEAQLEISTLEIDRDRQQIQAQALTIGRLQQELQRLHARVAEADLQFGVLRRELQTELDDKRRVMNDANAALEAQIRCEEEIDRLRLSLDARPVVSLSSSESATQVRLLQREVVDLESRLQHKVLRVSELEEAVRVERQKVALLEARLERSQGNKVEMPVSPVSPLRPWSFMSRCSSVSSTNEYCEICEEYGHEVMACKASSMMEYLDKSSCYCVNCDQFDTHPTEECPNRDEMF